MTVVPLVQALDAERFGGKAAALARSLQLGFDVPDGVAVDVGLVAAVAAGDPAALERCAGLVQSPVAVRSSALDEDGEHASFAGQHTTCLGVDAAGLAEALCAVWASATGDGPRAYRERLGLPPARGIAAVVQRMVAPDVSGVLFTVHPATGADERVIEAVWGLGEAAVSGLVTPEHVRMARGGAVLQRIAGDQDVRLDVGADGVVERPCPPKSCLDADRLAALETLATRCEAAFAGPSDIEFAFEGGRLFLLQRRPVTR